METQFRSVPSIVLAIAHIHKKFRKAVRVVWLNDVEATISGFGSFTRVFEFEDGQVRFQVGGGGNRPSTRGVLASALRSLPFCKFDYAGSGDPIMKALLVLRTHFRSSVEFRRTSLTEIRFGGGMIAQDQGKVIVWFSPLASADLIAEFGVALGGMSNVRFDLPSIGDGRSWTVENCARLLRPTETEPDSHLTVNT